MSRPALPLVALLLSLTLAGCGSDDEGPSTGGVAGSAGAGCAGTRLVVTEVATGETTTMEHAAAVSLSDGAAYTIYATDFDIDADELSAVVAPTVPADGAMATISLTVFNATTPPDPIEAGTTIRYSDDFGVLTFRALQNKGTTVLGTNNNASGSVSVDEVGETVCIGVDYGDAEKSYSGTVEAPVKSL